MGNKVADVEAHEKDHSHLTRYTMTMTDGTVIQLEDVGELIKQDRLRTRLATAAGVLLPRVWNDVWDRVAEQMVHHTRNREDQ